MKKRLLVLLLFMLLILFMTYQFEFNGGNEDKNRLFTGVFTSLINRKSNETERSESLISAEELKGIINKEGVELISISNKELGSYIPDSSRMTIEEITTTKNGVEGLIADQDQIEKVLSKKGLEPTDTIVVYDENQSLFAARLWWTLKAYGHKDVRVLDGGLKQWEKKGYETVQVPKIEQKSNYKTKPLNENMIARLKEIEKSINDPDKIVIDVRSEKEFEKGHIPNAVNIPWSKALNADGTFKSPKELNKLYTTMGITKQFDLIYTQCTKGVRASHTYFVLTQLLNYQNVKLYDGSWLEYSQSNLPVEKNN